MSFQVFLETETLVALGTGEFLLSFFVANDHVSSEGVLTLTLFIANSTLIWGETLVRTLQMGVPRCLGAKPYRA